MRKLGPYLLAALAYIGLRLAAFLPGTTSELPDTGTYISGSRLPLLSRDFWAGHRAWTVPLFYKVLPDSTAWRSGGQLAASILCWLVLAGVVAWCLRGPAVRFVGFGAVLLFSLSEWITQWDKIILSESPGISLTALALAAWLVAARLRNRWAVLAALAVSVAWVFARDSTAYLLLGAVPFVIGWSLVVHRVRAGVALSVALVAIFAASVISTSNPTASKARWEQPMHNVIGKRVMVRPGELDWFRDRGMPYPAALRRYAGTYLGVDYFGVGRLDREDPRFKPWIDWVYEHSRATLATYLLTHPGYAVHPLFDSTARNDLFDGSNHIDYLRARGTARLLPDPVQDVVDPQPLWILLAWALVVAAAGVWLAIRGAARTIWLVPATALALQPVHAALVWHGDAAEIARHAVLVGVMTRVSLILLTLFLIDAALEARRSRARQP